MIRVGRHKNKKFIRRILVLLLFVSLCGSGFLAYRSLNKKSVQALQSNNQKAAAGAIDTKKGNENNKENKPASEENKENSGQAAGEATATEPAREGTKVAYLTFDDGPTSNISPQILDILKKENIKATFFVLGSMAEKNPSVLKREKDEGHVVANHTYSHDYKYVYKSTSIFVEDLKRCDSVVTSIIGDHNHTLVRFPGGAFNSRKTFVEASKAAGYHHVDWNCLNGDAEAQHRSPEQLIDRVKQTAGGQKSIIILMHDAATKQTTAQALPAIIQYLRSNGYVFKTLQ